MRRWLPWVAAIVVAVVIQVLVVALVSREVPRPASNVWQPIAPVSIRSLPSLATPDGTAVPAVGRPAVIYFWATWCAPCVLHLPETLALSRALAGDTDVWLVSRDDHWQSVVRHFDGAPPPNVVHDLEGRYGAALGVSVLPTSFYFDGSHLVARTLDELSDPEAIRAMRPDRR